MGNTENEVKEFFFLQEMAAEEAARHGNNRVKTYVLTPGGLREFTQQLAQRRDYPGNGKLFYTTTNPQIYVRFDGRIYYCDAQAGENVPKTEEQLQAIEKEFIQRNKKPEDLGNA